MVNQMVKKREKVKIDPWSSLEVKDYSKLASEFGIDSLKEVYKKIPLKHNYFERGIVFGHKGFETIVEAIKNKKPFAMLTGLMPSGKFHFGHKIVADLMVYFQKLGAECYIVSADVEAYLTRNISREEGKKIALEEYLVNYIALGLEARKTHFYFQSQGSKEYMNLSKFVAKKTTFNELRAVYGDITPEKIISSFTQVADILYPQLKENGGPKPVVVPVGVDQLPHINLTRDIAKRMKTEYNFVTPSATFNIMLPGLQGGKMSSSKQESYIALTDSAKDAEHKIKKYAFSGGQATIEEHRKKGGNPEIDVSFQYLRIFFEPDDKKLNKIEDDYRSGKLLTSELKQILIDKMSAFLHEHQKKRELARKQVDKFLRKY